MKVNFILGTRANTDILVGMAISVEYSRIHLLKRDIFFYWEIIGGRSDPRNANVLMTHLVGTEVPYLILVDRDIVFQPEMLLKLYQRMQEGYDFISGLYCLRSGKRLAGTPLKEPYFLDGKVQEFKYITSGFTGYSLRLLNAVKEKNNLQLFDDYYPFCEEKFNGKELLGWDLDFCEKAHEAGFKTYVDTSIQVGHVGEKVYTIQDFAEYQEKYLKDEVEDANL